jgi:hypothetical protein
MGFTAKYVDVMPVQGPAYRVQILPIDQISWERYSGKPIGKVESGEDLLWQVHHAYVRDFGSTESFDVWLATVADFEVSEESVDPTRPDPSNGSLSSSRW